MQGWQSTFLGIRALPRDLSEFELQAFFTFDADELRLIETRRSDAHRLGLALHIGFIRLSGQLLDAKRTVPASLWRHLGTELCVVNPEIASLKAMYRRGRTLLEHQQMACNYLGVKRMREHQRRALVRVLRDEVQRSGDSDQLLVFARTWLYRHKLLIPHARALRAIVAAALVAFECATNQSIAEAVPSDLLNRWRAVLTAVRGDGQPTQSWLWAAPAKHSTRQMTELFERIEALYALDVQMHMRDVSDWTLTRFARRLAGRSPSVSARIKAPSRTVEVACFLRFCLLSATDRLLLMVQRRISDIARSAANAVTEPVSWAALYKHLLAELSALAHAPIPLLAPENDTELRAQLCALLAAQAKHKPATRAARIREQLLDTAAPSVRTLLAALVRLSWSAEGDAHPMRVALRELSAYYANRERFLAQGAVLPELGAAWRSSIMGDDRQRALIAFEMATVFALRRALRNGSIWIEHSLSFKGRARLFFAPNRWTKESGAHYSRLSLPRDPGKFLEPLIAKVRMGAEAVAAAVHQGVLRIDDELHIDETDTEEESPEITALRDKLDARIGSVQLPEVILAVDAQVRFSWLMLGREPRSADELLMVYAGIIAHGTSLSAAECSRMIPQLSASSIRQAMRWVADERRLGVASQAVLEFMHRHPIAESWGRADLASSDMMSMETTKRVWQARMDPRRNTPSVGIYSHVRDRWGVFYAQPFVLNERQAGVAIEGVVRNERIVTRQLAVDTHGYTDFAMTLSRLLGFDLCPRLKELKQRQLFLPRGMSVPVEIGAACRAEIKPQLIVDQWDRLVNLAAAVSSGHASAVATLARFGSAATGDPVYDAGVQLGKLLRTSFLSDYFTNPSFRHELRRVLNRGEAVNAMKRSIYTGRIAPAQAKRTEEMQAVADALNLLANIVMAWNTTQLQAVLGRWANRRQFIAPELTGKIAPTRLEGINLRGIFRFPTERYAEQLLPSRPVEKTPRVA